MSKYRQEYLLGAGGMGRVYRATRIVECGAERPVACKMMKPELVGHPIGVQRFHREALLTIDLEHDHVVRMIDYVVDDAGPYLITELIEGVSVAEILDDSLTSARLSFDMVRVIVADVLDALAYMHGRGVLHRDISPSNMLVCQSGAIKVSDFGMAKAIASDERHSGNYLGKVAYQAPEVRKGRVVDARSDLFSLAACVYELLTGEPPFGKRLPEAALRRFECDVAPLPDEVPDDLRQLVMGLLVKEPDERRPQTAREALGLLRMPADQRAVAAELGEASAGLYEDKCARAQARLQQRFESPSARMIAARPVVEVLADTLPSLQAGAGSDEKATRATDGRERSEQRGNGRQVAHGKRQSGRRSRLAMMFAAMATIVLIVLWGSGEHGGHDGEIRAVSPEPVNEVSEADLNARDDAPTCVPSTPSIDGQGICRSRRRSQGRARKRSQKAR